MLGIKTSNRGQNPLVWPEPNSLIGGEGRGENQCTSAVDDGDDGGGPVLPVTVMFDARVA